MSNSAELALAETALKLGVSTTGCCEWDDGAAERFRRQDPLEGLTPEYIRDRVCEFIANEGGALHQVQEQGRGYDHREYYYKAIIPESGFKHGIFVELDLTITDPELPGVIIFNAHRQLK